MARSNWCSYSHLSQLSHLFEGSLAGDGHYPARLRYGELMMMLTIRIVEDRALLSCCSYGILQLSVKIGRPAATADASYSGTEA